MRVLTEHDRVTSQIHALNSDATLKPSASYRMMDGLSRSADSPSVVGHPQFFDIDLVF